ncbi:MAG: DUF3078 domain-containing protein [Paludibacteraceae bacterium]|nr:DUF3078 domain-containing protein [Paludibacteraceae bacterium]
MRQIHTLVALLFSVLLVTAQEVVLTDTPQVSVDTPRVIIYKDTFKVQDANVSEWTEEDMLFEMLALQSKDRARRDSLFNDSIAKREIFVHDSLVADLQYRDSLYKVWQQQIRDSLNILLAHENAQRAFQDSLTRDRLARDSVAKQINAVTTLPKIELTPSLLKDPQEDERESRRLLKYIYSPWRTDATIQVQFAQNYISPNWYQGGNKLNYNLLSYIKANAIYSKDNILWENLGEWRTGIANAPNDTLRDYTVTDDLFRIYSKFGYQVVKNLYVSAAAEFKTSMWNIYTPNTHTLKSMFFTPMRYSMDFGIDYKPVKDLSIVVAPCTYKLIYAYSTTQVAVTSLGISEGKRSLNQVGSSLRVKWKYTPIREVVIDTEFYLYTNYKEVEIDWQTDVNFILNRFFSARLSLHPRYDTTVKTDGKAKLQFKELLSIGFAHKFN